MSMHCEKVGRLTDLRICVDEILQLILNELNHPATFALLSKRHHQFTQDPYVRATYFLARYGRIQALYWALGRGKLMNERVLDVRMPFHVSMSLFSFEQRPPVISRNFHGSEVASTGRTPLPVQTSCARMEGEGSGRGPHRAVIYAYVCEGAAVVQADTTVVAWSRSWRVLWLWISWCQRCSWLDIRHQGR